MTPPSEDGRRRDSNWQLALTLLRLAQGPTLVVDETWHIEALNQHLTEALGLSESEMVGRPVATCVVFVPAGTAEAEARRELDASGTWTGDVKVCGAGGRLLEAQLDVQAIRDEEGRIVRSVFALSNLRGSRSSGRRSSQPSLDTATGLPKWTELRLILVEHMEQADARRQSLAVVLLDPANLRTISRTHGHHRKRELEGALARRLETAVGNPNLVSRPAGDTFALLYPYSGDAYSVSRFAERVLGSLQAPLRLEDEELFVQAHLGIAVYPNDGGDVDMLLRNAEVALEEAKAAAPIGYRFFAEEMHEDACRRASLEASLHGAIQRGELELYFQPQVSIRDHRIAGAEALLRWRTEQWGSVSPAVFIPVAEEIGLIGELGEWALRNAARTYAEWLDQGFSLPKLAVNVSALQLEDSRLSSLVAEVLAGLPGPGGILELEFTESAVIRTATANLQLLDDLRMSGVRLSIDDFGTGYSSLHSLNKVPVDGLKLDRSFISGAEAPKNAAVVDAIMAMAHRLGLEVVAEGVETQKQLRRVEGLGCEIVQGYLFSRPLSRAEFEAVLEAGVLPPGNTG